MSLIEPLNQAQIENQLDALGDRLADEVERYAVLTVERAQAEADYKRRYHRAILQTTSGTVAQKEAHAHLRAADDFRNWKIAEAQEKATQQALIALRTRIETARTISANVRAAGG